MEERKQAQDAFRKTHRVLVSTDAGGEGLNLQFAHVIINYDIPWNPMRLLRVDRPIMIFFTPLTVMVRSEETFSTV